MNNSESNVHSYEECYRNHDCDCYCAKCSPTRWAIGGLVHGLKAGNGLDGGDWRRVVNGLMSANGLTVKWRAVDALIDGMMGANGLTSTWKAVDALIGGLLAANGDPELKKFWSSTPAR